MVVRAGEAEMDEMWSFCVIKGSNAGCGTPHHRTGAVLAYGLAPVLPMLP